MTDTFRSVSERFYSEGRDLEGAFYAALADGGFGSGALVRDGSGDSFVVTNAHVVAGAESVLVRFSESDLDLEEPDREVEGTVVFSDPEYDLAVIRLATPVEANALDFAEREPEDGAEIWSAGYPGLMARPTWQFASGNVTNRQAVVPELLSAEGSYLIQHSAPIDPGSSGGPLLIATPGGESEYQVLGINTWRAFARENTSYAVPARYVSDMLERAMEVIDTSESITQARSALERRVDEFVEFLETTDAAADTAAPYISYSLTATEGWRRYDFLVRSLPTAESAALRDRFVFGAPIEAMRESIAIVLHKDAPSRTVATGDLPPGDDLIDAMANDVRVVVPIQFENGAQQTEWIFEHGHWRLAKASWLEEAEGEAGERLPAEPSRDRNEDEPDFSGAAFGGGINRSHLAIGLRGVTTESAGIGYVFGTDQFGQLTPSFGLGWDFSISFIASEIVLTDIYSGITRSGTLGFTAVGTGGSARVQTALFSSADSGDLLVYGGVGARVEFRFPRNVLTMSTTEIDADGFLDFGISAFEIVPRGFAGVEYKPADSDVIWGTRFDAIVTWSRLLTGAYTPGDSGYRSFALGFYGRIPTFTY